jgi:hypothetical protein
MSWISKNFGPSWGSLKFLVRLIKKKFFFLSAYQLEKRLPFCMSNVKLWPMFKGAHEILGLFLPVWMHLGLNMNRSWFLKLL